MKKTVFVLYMALSLFLPTLSASAHVPEIVNNERNFLEEPLLVENPEVSKAFYGRLSGTPHRYLIVSDEPFNLYVSLLAPYIGQEDSSELEFHIMKDGEKIVMMHGYDNWEKWYEEFGGDWYLQGPVYEAQAPSGTYIIEVHSETNSEDYTLAIGRLERFGLLDTVKVVFLVPLIKALFWGNYVNIAFYGVAVLVLGWWLWRRRLSKINR
ncbi:hypothetical protein E4H04_11585 [Candidatus Bathyarchaeota archaeon]|nr:MAG: hypothetical protein E4H04_11585 [Candidatus Bathyarchaeota archaeon]